MTEYYLTGLSVMNKLVDAFLHRVAPQGIHHYTVDIDPDEALGLDTWGNEWEADKLDQWLTEPHPPAMP
jgi:hypothetical protein